MGKPRRIKNFSKASNESSSHGTSAPNQTSSRHPEKEVGSSQRGANIPVQSPSQILQSPQQRVARPTRVANAPTSDPIQAPCDSQGDMTPIIPVQPPNDTSLQHESNVPVQPPNQTSLQREANVPVHPPNQTSSQSTQPMAARPKRRAGRKSSHYWSVDALDEENDTVRELHLLPKDVNNLPDELRIIVNFDECHSPIGEAAGLLAGVCGLVATHSPFFPISFDRWSDMPDDYFEEQWKTLFEPRFCFKEGEDLDKRYNEGSIGKKWRDYRLDLWDKTYDSSMTKNEIVNRKPQDIPLEHWAKFVEYRLKPVTMEMCRRNKEVRKKQLFSHTCGAMTLARKKHIIALESGKPVGRGLMWNRTHKRGDGSYVNDKAKEIGEKIERHINENPDSSSEISPNDIVGQIFGKEHSGRVRAMGMGVVPTIAFKRTATRLRGMEFCSSSGSTSSGSSSLVNQKLATMEAQMKALLGYIKAKEGGSLPAELAAALYPNDTPQASDVRSESSTHNGILRSSDASNAHEANQQNPNCSDM